jgi:hypothetical protein
MDTDEDVTDLSVGDCNIPESPTLDVWIAHIELMDIKMLMGAKDHISYCLGEIELYKWFYGVLIETWLFIVK